MHDNKLIEIELKFVIAVIIKLLLYFFDDDERKLIDVVINYFWLNIHN